MPRSVVFATAAVAALSVISFTPAFGALLVLGSGSASLCSRAAFDGRSDARSVETCTLALTEEALGPRDRAGTFVNRGIIKMRRKDFDEARVDFSRALRIQPELGEAYVNRGASLIAERKYAAGMSEIDRGLALGVDEPAKAWFNRAIAYEGLGDPKNAYLAYRKAVELEPTWEQPQLELTRFSVTTR